MDEYISEFVALLVFVVITAVMNYHSDTKQSKQVFSWVTLFGLILLVWWIVKFIILGVLIK